MNRTALVVLAIAALALLAGCGKPISNEQYIDAMASLGCKNTGETAPAGTGILKAKNITLEQIQDFRKKMDPAKVLMITTDIARRVMACHGVQLPPASAAPVVPAPQAP